MDDTTALVLKKLEEIEAEMHRIGYWKQQQPEFDFSECKEAFCADKLSFEEWLQFIFLVNARNAAETNTLPRESMVGLKAIREYDYESVAEEAMHLKKLLLEFDSIITG